ncbi:DUF4913 domain-containing protein [Aquipuribacter hungaricus]|uniref:DUF4913 domain-containing protein n=1 Tax=Aquipuribacter hungaricus TaxID=545624 RepID=A0ABV7WMW2_9MICO
MTAGADLGSSPVATVTDDPIGDPAGVGQGGWGATDEWAEDTGAGPEPADTASPEEDAPQLYFPTVEVFVRELLAPTYRRSLDGRHRTWCPQWWRHAEAIVRLDALWRAWEHLRLEPALGISVWLRDHADPHMATLLDPDGPFKGCSPEKGHDARLKPLPCDEPPVGLF